MFDLIRGLFSKPSKPDTTVYVQCGHCGANTPEMWPGETSPLCTHCWLNGASPQRTSDNRFCLWADHELCGYKASHKAAIARITAW